MPFPSLSALFAMPGRSEKAPNEKQKVLIQKVQEQQKLLMGLYDELGIKAAIFWADDKGKMYCSSSLAAPGFHLLFENTAVDNLLTTHVTSSGSSDLMTIVDESMRTDKSKTNFLRNIVYDLQTRRDKRRGERPIIQRSRLQTNRAMEVSRMSKQELITLLLAYANDGMKMPRSVRSWLEAKKGLTPRNNNTSSPESFCTQVVSTKLASFTKPLRPDDRRTRGNADASKKAQWKDSGESNLNKNIPNNRSQQQLEEDADFDETLVGGEEELRRSTGSAEEGEDEEKKDEENDDKDNESDDEGEQKKKEMEAKKGDEKEEDPHDLSITLLSAKQTKADKRAEQSKKKGREKKKQQRDKQSEEEEEEEAAVPTTKTRSIRKRGGTDAVGGATSSDASTNSTAHNNAAGKRRKKN